MVYLLNKPHLNFDMPTFFKHIAFILLTFGLLGHASTKPNVLFILVDDLGSRDVGYVTPSLNTPHINQLAKESLIFSDAYSATVCTPSRAAILTGRSPARLKITSHIPGIGFEKYYERKKSTTKKLYEAEMKDHLPLEEITIAEAFKSAGYKTAFFGKWHLSGEGSVFAKNGVVNADWHPQAQGFDINIGGCAYGQPKKGYFSPYFNGEMSDGPKGEYLTDRLAQETIDFISEHKEQPFFAYLSFYSIHTPLNPKPSVKSRTTDKYDGMIYCMDDAVGKVIQHLNKLKLRENTLIVFTSDNGGMKKRPPLRGNKGKAYEGGIRVPLLYSWPSKIRENKTIATPVACEDFFPTLLDYLNIDNPVQETELDGISYASILRGENSIAPRSLFQHFPHHREGDEFNGSSTIRTGDWKLIWWHEADRLELFNLKKDIGEANNLASQQIERAQSMKKELTSWLKKVDANMARPNPYYKAN